jgi:hypothetical protein
VIAEDIAGADDHRNAQSDWQRGLGEPVKPLWPAFYSGATSAVTQ